MSIQTTITSNFKRTRRAMTKELAQTQRQYPRLDVKALAKSYGTGAKTKVIIEDLTFTVETGEVVCICLLYTSDAADE